jgi:hypothetical protein
LAVPADPVELELVPHELEPLPSGHLVLQLFDAIVLEFDDPFAFDTDQMVVVLVGPGDLVA